MLHSGHSVSLYDLHIRKDCYDEETNEAKDVIQQMENKQVMVRNTIPVELL